MSLSSHSIGPSKPQGSPDWRSEETESTTSWWVSSKVSVSIFNLPQHTLSHNHSPFSHLQDKFTSSQYPQNFHTAMTSGSKSSTWRSVWVQIWTDSSCYAHLDPRSVNSRDKLSSTHTPNMQCWCKNRIIIITPTQKLEQEAHSNYWPLVIMQCSQVHIASYPTAPGKELAPWLSFRPTPSSGVISLALGSTFWALRSSLWEIFPLW